MSGVDSVDVGDLGHSMEDEARTSMSGGFMGGDTIELREFGEYVVHLITGVEISRRISWPSVVTDDDGTVRPGWKWVNVAGDGASILEKFASLDQQLQRSIDGWSSPNSTLTVRERYLYLCFLRSAPNTVIEEPFKIRMIMLRKGNWTDLTKMQKHRLPNKPDVLLNGPMHTYDVVLSKERSDDSSKPVQFRVQYGAYPLDTTKSRGKFPALALETNPTTGNQYGLRVPPAEYERLGLQPLTIQEFFTKEEWDAIQAFAAEFIDPETGKPMVLRKRLTLAAKPMPEDEITAKLVKFPINWNATNRKGQAIFRHPENMERKAKELGLPLISPEMLARASSYKGRQQQQQAAPQQPAAVPAPAEPVSTVDTAPDPWPATQQSTDAGLSSFPAASAEESKPEVKKPAGPTDAFDPTGTW